MSERAVIQLAARRDPVKIARMHAWLVRAWAGMVACYASAIPALDAVLWASMSGHEYLAKTIVCGWVIGFGGVKLVAVWASIGLQHGLASSRVAQVTSTILVTQPLLNLIVIPILSMQGYSVMRRAGYRVRWWGMSRQAIQRIGSNYCPNCLYNLEGLSTHKCPECGQEVRRSAGGTVPFDQLT